MCRSHFLNLNVKKQCKETTKIKIFILQFRNYYSKTVHVATKQYIETLMCSYQIAIIMQSLEEFYILFTKIFTILCMKFAIREWMTSETPNLHVKKDLNISKRKRDMEKLKIPSIKTPLEVLFC